MNYAIKQKRARGDASLSSFNFLFLQLPVLDLFQITSVSIYYHYMSRSCDQNTTHCDQIKLHICKLKRL